METSSTRVSSTRFSSFVCSLMGYLRWVTLGERGDVPPRRPAVAAVATLLAPGAGNQGPLPTPVRSDGRHADPMTNDSSPATTSDRAGADAGVPVLLHLCTPAERTSYELLGEIAPPSLEEAGFVHLSTPDQVALPAQRLFAGRTDLQLLVLDPAAIAAAGIEVRWEPGVPGDPEAMRFPHAYGAIPATAVRSVQPYAPGPDGFAAPTII